MSLIALFAFQLLIPTLALVIAGLIGAERDIARVAVAERRLGLR